MKTNKVIFLSLLASMLFNAASFAMEEDYPPMPDMEGGYLLLPDFHGVPMTFYFDVIQPNIIRLGRMFMENKERNEIQGVTPLHLLAAASRGISFEGVPTSETFNLEHDDPSNAFCHVHPPKSVELRTEIMKHIIRDFVDSEYSPLDIDAQAIDGATPLHVAVLSDNASAVRAFLEAGAKRHGFDTSGLKSIWGKRNPRQLAQEKNKLAALEAFNRWEAANLRLQQGLTFAMAFHPRLGTASQLHKLPQHIVQQIITSILRES